MRDASGGVLVIGEAVMDLVSTSRGLTRSPGGSPANVALGLARLGIPTRLRTALSADDDGRAILARLEASGVTVDSESICLPRTSTALAVLDTSGAAEYDFDLRWRVPEPVAVGTATIIHTGSIALFLEPGAAAVAALLGSRSAGVLVSIDPNIRPAVIGDRDAARLAFERAASLADIVKLSDEDAAWLYPGEPVDAVLDRLTGSGVALAALTLGSAGAILGTRAHRVSLAALPIEVRDTVGAGDSFMAGLLAGVRRAAAPIDALDSADLDRLGSYAAAAAAVTVGRVGADLPRAIDIERMLRTAIVERCTTGSVGTVLW